MKVHLLPRLLLFGALFCGFLHASPKYSTPVDKLKPNLSTKAHQPPPLPTGHIKNYVEFDLKPQGSRYGHHEHHEHHLYGGHGGGGHYEHFYPAYDYSPYYVGGKGHDYHHMLPYIIGGFGILMLPIVTLMLTLAVNIAPASNIPTAVTTATGRLVDSFNSTKLMTDIRDALEAALDKYGKP